MHYTNFLRSSRKLYYTRNIAMFIKSYPYKKEEYHIAVIPA